VLPCALILLCAFLADFDSKKKRKVAEIYQALNSDPIDVAALRRMAISEGGLLTDEIRCKVWPKLLSVNTDDLPPLPGTGQPQQGSVESLSALGFLCLCWSASR